MDELTDVNVDIRPDTHDEVDDSDCPTLENFMLPDTFRDIMEQGVMELSEISVAFPLQHNWQTVQQCFLRLRKSRKPLIQYDAHCNLARYC